MISDPLKDDSRALAKQEAQREQLKRDRANLPRREDLARFEIRNGSSPTFVAFKYGLDVERCVQYSAALEVQREKRANG